MTTEPDSAPAYDWGGDGSDLHQTVRAHHEAALVPTDAPYAPPVDQLLRLGDVTRIKDMDSVLAGLGLTQADAPELVRMARDRALNTGPSDADEIWAPIYALEALKRFDVRPYVADLIPLFDVNSEWFGEELPRVLATTGEVGLEAIRPYLLDTTRWVWGRAYASSVVTEIVKERPDLRGPAIQVLSDALAQAALNAPEVNSSLLVELLDLDAVEALPVIRQAFEADVVDETVTGDWDHVVERLGQPIDMSDPLVLRARMRRAEAESRRRQMFGGAATSPALPPAGGAPKRRASSTQKSKRKMASASRKQNKRKKRK